jgi:hypothetical protein
MESLGDGGGDDASTTPEDTSPSTTGTTETLPAGTTPAEIDALAQALGIAGTGNDKWKSRVPYSKVSKVWKEQQAKLKAEHETALKTHTDKLTQYEQERSAMAEVERLIQSDPEKFVQSLVQLNPAYGRYLAGGQASTERQPLTSMPQPDVRLTDGRATYSPEQAAALAEWKASEAVKGLEQRIAPFEQERQSRELHAALLPKVQAQMADAATWPLFNEHKAEILTALQANAKISLEQAYQKVVLPKMAATRDQQRAEILKELNAQPHSTSAIPSSATSARDDAGPVDTSEIVRRTLSGLR